MPVSFDFIEKIQSRPRIKLNRHFYLKEEKSVDIYIANESVKSNITV